MGAKGLFVCSTIQHLLRKKLKKSRMELWRFCFERQNEGQIQKIMVKTKINKKNKQKVQF